MPIVFPRYPGESLKLFTANGEIEVTVDSLSPARAILSVKAPAAVTILRGECEPDPARILSRLASTPK